MSDENVTPSLTEKPVVLLPTGKPHVSHSELVNWVECSWRHRLKHVLKIDLDAPSTNLAFGSAVHAACEHYLKHKVIDLTEARKILDEEWEKHETADDFVKNDRDAFMKTIAAIMNDVGPFLDATFPGWELVEAEEPLYEDLKPFFEKHEGVSFKGFIDAILRVPGKKAGTWVYWILDWKSANRPWYLAKIKDENVRRQLQFYKHFWATKHNVDIKDIRCGFVTLIKSGKPGKFCSLIPISVGDVTIKRALTVLNNGVASIKRGVAIKNRNSCKWCPYKNTEYCT